MNEPKNNIYRLPKEYSVNEFVGRIIGAYCNDKPAEFELEYVGPIERTTRHIGGVAITETNILHSLSSQRSTLLVVKLWPVTIALKRGHYQEQLKSTGRASDKTAHNPEESKCQNKFDRYFKIDSNIKQPAITIETSSTRLV